MSWDLNLCLGAFEKVLVPFHHFCKPRTKHDPPPKPNSLSFFRLPVDIQLIVYDHCDAPTLFHLIRTCSVLRRAATKRFWANTFTNQWYYCPDYWLLEHKTRTYVVAPHCSEFAAKITNIKINMIRLELRFVEDGEDCDEDDRASTVTKARVFWTKVAKAFSSVARIPHENLVRLNLVRMTRNTPVSRPSFNRHRQVLS